MGRMREPTRIAIVTDPQLTDFYSYRQKPGLLLSLTEHFSDTYMRKAYSLMQVWPHVWTCAPRSCMYLTVWTCVLCSAWPSLRMWSCSLVTCLMEVRVRPGVTSRAVSPVGGDTLMPCTLASFVRADTG